MQFRHTLLLSAAMLFASAAYAGTAPIAQQCEVQDTGQQCDVLTNDAGLTVHLVNNYTAVQLQPALHQAVKADSAFNPRTAFPKKVEVATAGFGPVLSLQGCCDGQGWSNAFMENRWLYLTLTVAIVGALLFAVKHRRGYPLQHLFKGTKTPHFTIGASR